MIPKAIQTIMKRKNLNEAYRVMLEDHYMNVLDKFALLNTKLGDNILAKCKAKMDSDDGKYDDRLKETIRYLKHEEGKHKDLFTLHVKEEELSLTSNHEKF